MTANSYSESYNRTVTIPSDATYAYDLTYNGTTALLDSLSYPTSTSSYRLKLQYGILQRISDANAPATVSWGANATDVRGHITQDTLGMGSSPSGLLIACLSGRTHVLAAFLSVIALLSSSTAVAAIGYVQNAWTNPSAPTSSVTATFASAQTAGDINLFIVGWADFTSTVSSVTDSKGNVYTLAVGPTRSSGNASQSIYYAKNIASAVANANTVTVTFSTAVAYPDLCILEYSGVSTTTPVDVSAAAASTGTALDSGAMATTVANDWIVLGDYIQHGTTSEGGGFTERLYDDDSQVAADAIEGTAGTYHATATQDSTGWWILSAVALQPANTGGDTQSPTTPFGLTATAVSNTQVNLSWTASTDNVGVTGYRIELCQGPSCSSFSQIDG